MNTPVNLFSRIIGEEVNPPLIILHGLLGSCDNWQSLGKLYSSEYCVHLIDARNHGRSPHADKHTYGVMSEDLLKYFNIHNIKKASLLGHSMGGKTVMLFSEYHPERVEKMIVADIAPRKYLAHHQPIFEALKSIDLSSDSSRNSIRNSLLSKLDNSSSLVPLLMKGLRRKKEGGYSWRYNVEVLASNLENVTESIQLTPNTTPTLFIRGLKSNYISDRDLFDIESLYLQLETAEIEGVGHWLHAEAPEEFYEITKDFLLK